jgi:hypothetical protein
MTSSLFSPAPSDYTFPYHPLFPNRSDPQNKISLSSLSDFPLCPPSCKPITEYRVSSFSEQQGVVYTQDNPDTPKQWSLNENTYHLAMDEDGEVSKISLNPRYENRNTTITENLPKSLLSVFESSLNSTISTHPTSTTGTGGTMTSVSSVEQDDDEITASETDDDVSYTSHSDSDISNSDVSDCSGMEGIEDEEKDEGGWEIAGEGKKKKKKNYPSEVDVNEENSEENSEEDENEKSTVLKNTLDNPHDKQMMESFEKMTITSPPPPPPPLPSNPNVVVQDSQPGMNAETYQDLANDKNKGEEMRKEKEGDAKGKSTLHNDEEEVYAALRRINDEDRSTREEDREGGCSEGGDDEMVDSEMEEDERLLETGTKVKIQRSPEVFRNNRRLESEEERKVRKQKANIKRVKYSPNVSPQAAFLHSQEMTSDGGDNTATLSGPSPPRAESSILFPPASNPSASFPPLIHPISRSPLPVDNTGSVLSPPPPAPTIRTEDAKKGKKKKMRDKREEKEKKKLEAKKKHREHPVGRNVYSPLLLQDPSLSGSGKRWSGGNPGAANSSEWTDEIKLLSHPICLETVDDHIGIDYMGEIAEAVVIEEGEGQGQARKVNELSNAENGGNGTEDERNSLSSQSSPSVPVGTITPEPTPPPSRSSVTPSSSITQPSPIPVPYSNPIFHFLRPHLFESKVGQEKRKGFLEFFFFFFWNFFVLFCY